MDHKHYYKKINKLDKGIINYANLIDGLFLHQKKELDLKKLKLFSKKPEFGIPILFKKKSFFLEKNIGKDYNVSKNFLLKNIFRTKKKNYKPFLNLFNNNNKFIDTVIIKKEYIKQINFINYFNIRAKKKILKIHQKFNKVCAFQTRNIPHYGHEKILSYLLKKYDHVVVNPIIGPKKRGDIDYNLLKKIYSFLIKKKFRKNVSYIPFIANMFYAGPLEAIHHANMRFKLGFNYFIIGRDHAGSDKCYNPLSAYKLVKKLENKIKINIDTIQGAYHCKICKKVVLKNDCKHKNLENISGTKFRKFLFGKKYFKYADRDLQKFVKKII